MDTAVGVMLLLVAIGLYILPAIIAGTRNHPQQVPITVITALLGWTGIAWVVTLAWSLSSIEPVPAR